MKFFLTISIIAFLAFNFAEAGGPSGGDGCPDCTGVPLSTVCGYNRDDELTKFDNVCEMTRFNCIYGGSKFFKR